MPKTEAQPTFTVNHFLRSKDQTVFEETVMMESKTSKRKKIVLQRTADQQLLLQKFLNVFDEKTLLSFLRTYGLPKDLRHSIVRDNRHPLLNPETRIVIMRLVEPYLELAATLRWLLKLLRSVDTINHSSKEHSDLEHEMLEKWITASDDPKSFSLLPDPVQKIRLTFRLNNEREEMEKEKGKPKSKEKNKAEKWIGKVIKKEVTTTDYYGWLASTAVLSEFTFTIPKNAYRHTPAQKHARLKFVKTYLAFHLSGLVQQVHPMVEPKGNLVYHFNSSFDAMCMALLNQFCGASGISICPNPDCPGRFYSSASRTDRKKEPRKQRRDKRYCGRARCYKWGQENIGAIRKPYEKARNKQKTK